MKNKDFSLTYIEKRDYSVINQEKYKAYINDYNLDTISGIISVDNLFVLSPESIMDLITNDIGIISLRQKIMQNFVESGNAKKIIEKLILDIGQLIEHENGKNIRTYKITEKVSGKSFAMDIVQEHCKSLLT